MIRTRNLDQYAALHGAVRYGATGHNKLKMIEPWIQIAAPRSILDYGAGQSRMVEEIRSHRLTVRDRYDPAIPDISAAPRERYDLVTCIDVLEHLDEGEVSAVVADVARFGEKAIFIVDTKKAGTILPNGENAHATIRPGDWWLARVREHFPDAELINAPRSRALIKSWTSGVGEYAAHAVLRYVVRRVLPKRAE
jgi:hypothetical protein